MRLKIARVTISPIALRLEKPIKTAFETLSVRRGFVVRLEDDEGAVGYGDAMPLPAFGTESLEVCANALERAARRLLTGDVFDASALRLGDGAGHAVPALALLSAFPCARAGLDVALFDLAARREGKSIANWILAAEARATAALVVPVHALIVAGGEPEVAARAAEAKRAGHRSFKLKVGSLPLADDVRRIAALRAAISADDRIRLDANGAFGEVDARRALAAFAHFRVDFIEQPVAAADLPGMGRLCRFSPIPIAADESLLGGRGEACLKARAADLLILKPAALGGLGPAWRLSQAGRKADVPAIVTSFFDSALGVAAALQLAAALQPGADSGVALPAPVAARVQHAAGIATHGILQTDLADLPLASEGELRCPTGPGLGIEPDPARLARLLTGRVWEETR